MSNIHVGDNGTTFEVIVSDDAGAVPLTTATSITGTFTKPDGTTFSKTFSATDAVNGKCSTTLTSSEINAEGIYSFKVGVQFVGSFFWSDTQKFLVKA